MSNGFQNVVSIKTTETSTNVKHIQNDTDILIMFNSLTKRYHCPRCDITFENRCGLSRHYQGHSGRLNYWCELCAKGYTVEDNLTDHVAREIWHKKFITNDSTLINHSKDHIN